MRTWQPWLIKAGENYSSGVGILNTGFTPLIWKSKMSYRIKFNDSARYDSSVYKGYNKIFGMSYPTPHWVSVRFGWKFQNSMEAQGRPIEIVPYVYDQGTRYTPAFFNGSPEAGDNGRLYVSIGDVLRMTIETFSDRYVFTVLNETTGRSYLTTYYKTFKWASCMGTQNYPYFGGELPAPHDVTIEYIPM